MTNAAGDAAAVPVVEVSDVSRCFSVGSQELWAVRDVSFRVAQGEFMALIGRSGSGKTTLLNLIAGLDRPTAGAIRVRGEDITNFSEARLTNLRRHDIGFVFQSFGLLPLLSAYENVEIALRIAGVSLAERRERTESLLEKVGLARRSHHRPYELSGGEQQRVAIARALANNPAIVLADEPTGELDSSTAVSIFQLLRDLVEHDNVTIITSTHDRTVMELASRIEEMRDGRLLRSDEQELFAYTTRDERTHFAAELPSDVRAEVAASTVEPVEQRHVVERRELPRQGEIGAPASNDGGGASLWGRPQAGGPDAAATPAPIAAEDTAVPDAPAPDAPRVPDFRPPPDAARPDWAKRRSSPSHGDSPSDAGNGPNDAGGSPKDGGGSPEHGS